MGNEPALLLPESVEAVYFENSFKAMRWPYTIYHSPIWKRIRRTLDEMSGARPQNLQCMNYGCGPFITFPDVSTDSLVWSAHDIDLRCLQFIESRKWNVQTVYELNSAADAQYDFLVAVEVIEHITDAVAWLKSLARLMKPGGRIVLTTPNYSVFSPKPYIEYTILEFLARRKGYSRWDIHPNKYNASKLRRDLQAAFGASSARISIETISCHMVLYAQIQF